MSDWPWVVASYTLTWLVLGVYALRTLRGLEDARRRLEVEARAPARSDMETES
jgi:hypothetical protein